MDEMPALPTEEDRVGDEETVLVEMLEFYRTVLLRKTWGLTSEQLGFRLEASDLTLAGLLWHMALVEDNWFTQKLQGLPQPSPWAEMDWEADRDWEFHHAHEVDHDQLVADFERSVARSRAAYAAAADGLDTLLAVGFPDGKPISLRWVMVHMIEEYARHAGHADLIRQSVDGATGD